MEPNIQVRPCLIQTRISIPDKNVDHGYFIGTVSVLSPPCFLGSHCALALQLETDNWCTADWKKLIMLHYLFHHRSTITTVKSISASLKETWINHLAIPSGTVNSLIQAVCHGPLKIALTERRGLSLQWACWSKGLCRQAGEGCTVFWRITRTAALLAAGSSGPNFCPLLILSFRGSLSSGIWGWERCFLGCKKWRDEVAVAVQVCWSTSLQCTSLSKPWGHKGWWRVAERQDLSPSSHIIFERKCQCQARQEDFLIDGKVKVREDPDPSGDSSALGEGRSRVMELDLPYSPPMLVTASYNQWGKHLQNTPGCYIPLGTAVTKHYTQLGCHETNCPKHSLHHLRPQSSMAAGCRRRKCSTMEKMLHRLWV